MDRSKWLTRALTTAAVLACAALAWGGVPGFVAAGKALDHPAWSDPTNDPGNRALGATTSWWPPGRRYVWVSGRTGRIRTAIDPWTNPIEGHAWTAVVLVLTGVIMGVIWKFPRRGTTTSIVGTDAPSSSPDEHEPTAI